MLKTALKLSVAVKLGHMSQNITTDWQLKGSLQFHEVGLTALLY